MNQLDQVNLIEVNTGDVGEEPIKYCNIFFKQKF